jgi:hypothetical protein
VRAIERCYEVKQRGMPSQAAWPLDAHRQLHRDRHASHRAEGLRPADLARHSSDSGIGTKRRGTAALHQRLRVMHVDFSAVTESFIRAGAISDLHEAAETAALRLVRTKSPVAARAGGARVSITRCRAALRLRTNARAKKLARSHFFRAGGRRKAETVLPQNGARSAPREAASCAFPAKRVAHG